MGTLFRMSYCESENSAIWGWWTLSLQTATLDCGYGIRGWEVSGLHSMGKKRISAQGFLEQSAHASSRELPCCTVP